MKVIRRNAWYRGWAGFVVSVALIVSLFILALVGIGMLNQRSSVNDASDDIVTFSCHPSWNGEAFTIAANVDVTDGMCQDEAVIVANALFNNTMSQMVLRQLKSAQIDALGIWTVEFSWEYSTMKPEGYSTENLGHWFRAVIDPFNRAIVYDRCK